MIAIHICFDCKFLDIAESFLTSLQPMSDRAHDTLVAQSRGDAREHLLRLAIFCWVGLYRIWCASPLSSMRRSPIACLTLPGADINIMPVILSGPLYWRFSSNWKQPSESTLWLGAFGLFQFPGTREYWFCIKKISLILLLVVGMFLSLGEVEMGNGFLVLTGWISRPLIFHAWGQRNKQCFLVIGLWSCHSFWWMRW